MSVFEISPIDTIAQLFNSDISTCEISYLTKLSTSFISNYRTGNSLIEHMSLRKAEMILKSFDDEFESIKDKVDALLASDITSYTISVETNVRTQTIDKYRKKISKTENMHLETAEILAYYYDTKAQKEVAL